MTPTGASVAPLSVRDLLASVSKTLGPGPQARWIVAHVTGIRTVDLLAAPDVAVTPAAWDAARAVVDRCRAGEPLQYLLGTWAFRALELHVDRRVLIPRPETEYVVEVALGELAAQRSGRPEGSPVVAVDLGTGTGAIALSLAVECDAAPGSVAAAPVNVWAIDASRDALEVCRQNLAALARQNRRAAARVRVAHGSWFGALAPDLAGTVDLAVSNPPYVSESEWHSLDPVVRDHEPVAALVPGPTGFEAIETLLTEAPRWLASGGSLVVELAPDQARSAQERADALGYEKPHVRDDLAGRPRVLVARWPHA
jgi:release factor glutamine methyltransferase